MQLSRINAGALSAPFAWEQLFGRGADAPARPLLVEIGFGRGDYLLHLARQHPDADILGFEVSNRCLSATESKIERSGLTNVRVVHVPGETALFHLCRPASIDAIHLNFPDPWFKTGHRHRRIMRREVLEVITDRLKPGGHFYLATDIEAYAVLSERLLASTPGLTNLLDTPFAQQMPGRIVTKYEATAIAEGRRCYYFAYRRSDQPLPAVPVIEDLPMPHVVLATPRDLEDLRARFAPMKVSFGMTHVHVLDIYRGRHNLLFEVHVVEPTITQHIALTLIQRPRPETVGMNEYTLQLGTIGQPRPTDGVHRAVGLLSGWVLSLDPAGIVVKDKLNIR